MGRTLALAGTDRSGTARPPAVWGGTFAIALLLIIVAAVRLHELVPATSIVKPALLVTFGGIALLWANTTAAARAVVLRHPLVLLVFAYWAFMLITMPFALYPGLAFRTVQYFLPAVALIAAILLCRADGATLLKLQIGFVAATAAYAFYTKMFGRVFGGGRLAPGMGMYDSNDMAALLGLVFPLAVGLFRSQRGMLRTMSAGAALLIVMVVLASGSRGGILGLGAGAVVFTLGIKGSRRLVALAILATATAAIWTYSPSFKARMSTLTNLENDYNTYDRYGRKEVWKRGRQYIRENPVIGVGAGNFPIAEGDHFAVLYAGLRGAKWSNAHNAYVQTFAELGAIGGSIFVGILLLAVRYSLRLWRGVRLRTGVWLHRPELLASLCAFMVSAVFLSHAYFIPLIALVGLIGLADRIRAAGMQASKAMRVAPYTSALRGVEHPVRIGRVPSGFRYRGGLA
jgi:O-antigen ligase